MKRTSRTRPAIAGATWTLVLGGLLTVGIVGGGPRAVASPGGQSAAAAVTPAGEEGTIPTANLWWIFRSGGLLMYPIAACSILLVALVLERLVSLRHRRIIPKPFVTRFLDQMRSGDLEREQALALCEESGSPVSQVFAGAVRKWDSPSVEVEQAIIDAGERVTNGLRRYLRVINGISTITPLLGLLGTVFGMIRAFNAIATSNALGRPELLASGISEALLTTAAGLCVAIPALFFYMFFVGRVDRLIIDIDALSQELVPLISAEETRNRVKRPAIAEKTRRSLATSKQGVSHTVSQPS